MKYKVIKVDNRYKDVSIEKEILNKVGVELQEYNLHDEEKIIETTKDADGLIVDLSLITEKVIKNLNKCRVISKVGVGVDNINVPEATSKGIFVCNVPEYCIDEVSDHALALMLSLIRKVTYLDTRVKKGIWDIEQVKPVKTLPGSVLGLVGFGKIARKLCLKAKVFGLEIIVFDPYISNIDKKYKAQLIDFNTLVKTSDIISIHCPSNPDTNKLFNIDVFQMMKKNSYLVNTSRGSIVDSKALYEALKGNLIAGAAVDSYDPEPIELDDPVLKLDNFIITPHTGFYSEQSIIEVRRVSAINVAEVLMGTEPQNAVNKELLNNKSIIKGRTYGAVCQT